MLAYVFFIYGLALIASPSFLRLCAGVGFWVLRLVVQPLLFGARPRLSQAFMVLFAAGATIHALAAAQRRG